MIIIPNRQTKEVSQKNRGNILGDFWSTWNIDLQTNPGAIRVGTKFKTNVTTVASANLGFPVAIQYFDSRIWAICGDRIFKGNGATDLITPLVEDASTGFVITYNKDGADMITFNSELVAAADTKVWSKAANGAGTGAWTERGSTMLTAGTNHKMVYFKKFNRLYVVDNTTKIKSIDNSWNVALTGDYAIDLGVDVGTIVTMVATSDRIFIATVRQAGAGTNSISKASILEWDGVSNQVSNEIKIEAEGIVAMILLGNIPYVLDSNGVLREYQGTSFDEVGRLPLDKEFLANAVSVFNDRFTHPNGIISTKNGTIMVLVNNLIGDSAGSINENFPSGIWEWDRNNGFMHKHALTLQGVSTTTITDNGQNRIVKAGALANTNVYSQSASGRPTLMCGAQYYTDASTTTFAVFVDAPIPTDNATTTESKKYGYYVTNWLQSQNLKDVWTKFAIKFRRLLNSSDRIIIKYRTIETDPTYISMTWVNTTSFTTTTDLSTLVGYEVEIIQGTGSGKCAHISSVSGSGTFTVTLDEAFTGVTTGTAKARVQAWKKAFEVSDQLVESKIVGIGAISERIQLKVCMDFIGNNELHELIIISSANQALE